MFHSSDIPVKADLLPVGADDLQRAIAVFENGEDHLLDISGILWFD